MALSDMTVRKIMEACDIVDVVGSYLTLTKKGNSYFGLCPFHDDKNPSMSVSRDRKIFNCFSCGAKGNVLTFVSKFENLTYEQAALKLAGKYGLDIDVRIDPEEAKKERFYVAMEEASKFYQFYLHNSTEGQVALKYLEGRGIDEEIIRLFQIGLAPSGKNYLYQALMQKNIPVIDQIDLGLVKQGDDYYDLFRHRIMFPIRNHQGRTVAFSGRIYEQGGSDEPKYINSIETPLFHKSDVMYNFHNAAQSARQLNRIYIFEGFMDVIAGVKAGIHNSVAAMGTALTIEHIKELSSVTKNIVLCFDGDAAGILATRRAIPLLNNAHIAPQTVTLPDDLDPDEYLKAYGKEALVNYLTGNTISAYEFLYREARKNLISEDISSVDKFKREVFSFLRIAKSPLITDFYLKKMATDLNTTPEILALDMGRTNYAELPDNIGRQSPKPKITGKSFVKRINLALKVIIKNSILSKEYFGEYYQRHSGFYDNNFLNYVNLIMQIDEYYREHENFNDDDFKKSISGQPELLEAYEGISHDNSLGQGGHQELLDCIRTITDYLNQQDGERISKAAKDDPAKLTELVKHRQKTVQIKKEE